MKEFKQLLEDQPSIKVILNGGNNELTDATIPFTIGFSPEIAEQNPTHVLVIDIHENDSYYDEDHIILWNNSCSKRMIYELNKVNFIQFQRPGKRNLLFILLTDVTKETKKFLLEKEYRNSYQNPLILTNKKYSSMCCEVLVDIPTEFFSPIPERGTLKKAWWNWVNRWHSQEAIDQCEFRKRVPLAITLKPLVVLFVLLFRILLCTIATIIKLVIIIIGFVFGRQAQQVFREIGEAYWNYAIVYQGKDAEDVFSATFLGGGKDWNKFNHYTMGKYEFNTRMSLAGLFVQLCLWGGYLLYLWFPYFFPMQGSEVLSVLIASTLFTIATTLHLSFVAGANDWDWLDTVKSRILLFSSLLVVPFISMFFAQPGKLDIVPEIQSPEFSLQSLLFLLGAVVLISIVLFRKKAKLLVVETLTDLREKYKEDDKRQIQKEQSQILWLKQNMSLTELPTKVDLATIVAPTKTDKAIQYFKISFWTLKSKVCKPYAK